MKENLVCPRRPSLTKMYVFKRKDCIKIKFNCFIKTSFNSYGENLNSWNPATVLKRKKKQVKFPRFLKSSTTFQQQSPSSSRKTLYLNCNVITWLVKYGLQKKNTPLSRKQVFNKKNNNICSLQEWILESGGVNPITDIFPKWNQEQFLRVLTLVVKCQLFLNFRRSSKIMAESLRS